MAWYKNATYVVILSTIISAIILVSNYYTGTPLDQARNELFNWIAIMVSVMVWVGMINTSRIFMRDVTRRTPGRWYLAIFGLILTAVMLISGFGEGSQSQNRKIVSPITGGITVILWIWNNFEAPLAMAILALSGLWAIAAIYHSFKLRTWESFLFVFGAVFLILKNAPIGGVLWAGFPIIGDWIFDVPYTAIQRAITMGLGIGIVAYTLRYYLGREKQAYGVVE